MTDQHEPDQSISLIDLADKAKLHLTNVHRGVKRHGYVVTPRRMPSGRIVSTISAADGEHFLAARNANGHAAATAAPVTKPPVTVKGEKKKKLRAPFAPVNDKHKGQMLWLPVKDLVIPDQGPQGYQREEVVGHATRIATNFQWSLFGVLDIVKRLDLDGRLETADGGNRLRAARMRGDIAEVPCIVHKATTTQEAASIFSGINVFRRAIAFAPLHKAMLLAKDRTHELAQQAWEQLNSSGRIFEPIKPIVKFCRKEHEREAMLRVIPVLQILAYDSPRERITADFFKGLTTLEVQLAHRNLSVANPKLVKKMKQLGLKTLTDFAGLGVVFGRHPLLFAKVLASKERLNIRPNPFTENKKV